MSSSYSAATLTYEWRCSACNAAQRSDYSIPPGGEFLRPSLPEGWRETRSEFVTRFFCPRHQVSEMLFVDGKLVKKQ